MEKILRTFNGTGLNSDDELSLIPPGDSRYRENIEYEEGEAGAIVPARGNKLIENNTTSKLIGQCPYVEEDSEILFYSDSSIVQSKVDGTFTLLSEDSFWNFNENMHVDATVIGSGDDAYLVFTDGENEPKKVSLKHLKENDADFDYSIYNACYAKPAPLYKPTVSVETDSTIEENSIGYTMFQFSYRFYYNTNEISTWGPYSDLAYVNRSIYGVADLPSKYFNRIDVTYKVPDTSIVKVELAVRIADIGSGAKGDWYSIASLDTSSTGIFTYQFFNTEAKFPLDQTEFNYPFYNLPRKAKTVESLLDNRIAFGGITRGYNTEIEGASLTAIQEPITSFVYSSFPTYQISMGDDATFTLTKPTGLSLLTFQVYYVPDGESTRGFDLHFMLIDGSDTMDSIANKFVNKVNDQKRNSSLSLTVDSTTSTEATIGVALPDTFDSYGHSWHTVNLTSFLERSYPTLKSGSTYKLARIYYDNYARTGRAEVSESQDLYIPHQTELSLTDNDNYVNQIHYSISDESPEWAKYYTWAIANGSVDKAFSVVMNRGTTNPVMTSLFGDSDIEIKHNGVWIDLPTMIEKANHTDDGSSFLGVINGTETNVKTFDVEVGDYMRFVARRVLYEDAAWDQYFKLLDEYIELRVMDKDATTGKILVESWENTVLGSELSSPPDLNCYAYIVEFVRKSIDIGDENLLYFEVGDLLSCDGGYHEASVPDNSSLSATNQSDAQSASGVLNYGDFYKYVNFMGGAVGFFYHSTVETDSVNGHHNMQQRSLGRVNIVDSNFRERYENIITWTGKLSESGLYYNDLNRINDEDYVPVNDQYGEIVKILLNGFALDIIQEHKNSVSYSSASQMVDPAGGTQILSSDSVLSKPRPLQEDGGTTLPRAIAKSKSNLYFPDIHLGEVFRKSHNGLHRISDYKMSKWFKERLAALLSSGEANITAISCFDNITNCYLLSITDSSNSDNNFTIAFHEPSNRWLSFYTYYPSGLISFGTKLISIDGAGRAYEHHSDEVNRAYYYGTQNKSEMWVHVNDNPSQNKRFISLELDSDNVWEASDEDGIVIGEDVMHTAGIRTFRKKMQSRLKAAKFRYKNGRYLADFLRDALSSSGIFKAIDLVKGRPLMGKHMILKLQYTDIGKGINRLRSLITTVKYH